MGAISFCEKRNLTEPAFSPVISSSKLLVLVRRMLNTPHSVLRLFLELTRRFTQGPSQYDALCQGF